MKNTFTLLNFIKKKSISTGKTALKNTVYIYIYIYVCVCMYICVYVCVCVCVTEASESVLCR